MPAAEELIAHDRTEEEVERALGCDWLIYQDLSDLIEAVQRGNPNIRQFDTSCFNGEYVTGDIDQLYLEQLSHHRNDGAKSVREGTGSTIGLHNAG
jgi:amidophosphoribosyltransferase